MRGSFFLSGKTATLIRASRGWVSARRGCIRHRVSPPPAGLFEQFDAVGVAGRSQASSTASSDCGNSASQRANSSLIARNWAAVGASAFNSPFAAFSASAIFLSMFLRAAVGQRAGARVLLLSVRRQALRRCRLQRSQRRARRARRGFDHVRDVSRALLAGRRRDVLVVEIIELRRAVGVLLQLQTLEVFVRHILAVRGQVVILPVGYAFEFTEAEEPREQVFDVDGRLGVMGQLFGSARVSATARARSPGPRTS